MQDGHNAGELRRFAVGREFRDSNKMDDELQERKSELGIPKLSYREELSEIIFHQERAKLRSILSNASAAGSLRGEWLLLET